MRALVTGGNGFVGRRIVEMLLAQGDEVAVLGRQEYPELVALGAECFQGDVRNKESIMAAFKGVDVVFHVAAKVGLWGKRADFESINILGTENVINCCHSMGVPRLVFTSSPSVVFDSVPLCDANETLPYPRNFLSDYPETKALAEQLVIKANGTNGLSTCSLRPHLVWGPGDNHLLPGILRRAEKGNLIIVGEGDNIVDFTYIDNVAQAHLQAAAKLEPSSPVAGQCYFVSQNEPVRFWDFVSEIVVKRGYSAPKKRLPLWAAKAIGHICEASFRLLPLPGEPRITPFLAEQLAKSHYFSIDKAKADFGYEPKISMKVGIERTLAFLEEQGH